MKTESREQKKIYQTLYNTNTPKQTQIFCFSLEKQHNVLNQTKVHFKNLYNIIELYIICANSK